MSELNEIVDVPEHTLLLSIPVGNIPIVQFSHDFTHSFTSKFIKLGGIFWKWSVVKYQENGEVAPMFAFWLRCFCEAEPIFMCNISMNVWTNFDFIQQLDYHWQRNLKFDNDKVNWECLRFPLPPDEILRDGNLEIRLKIGITQAMSCCLKTPKFDETVDYHDICIVHKEADRKTEFYISSSILKHRCNNWQEMLKKPINDKKFKVKAGLTSSFHEFLKVLYNYSDDICARNYAPILRLSKLFGATQNFIFIENFLFRSQQVHVMEKIAIADKYQLKNVLAFYIPHIWGPEKVYSYSQREEMSRLSTEVLDKIVEDSLEIDGEFHEFPTMRYLFHKQKSQKLEIQGCRWSFTFKYGEKPSGSGFFLILNTEFAENSKKSTFRYIFQVNCRIGDTNFNLEIIELAENSTKIRRIHWLPVEIQGNRRITFDARIKIQKIAEIQKIPVQIEVFNVPKSIDNAILHVNRWRFYVNKEILASGSGAFAGIFRNTYGIQRIKQYRIEMNLEKYCIENLLNHLYHGEKTIQNRNERDQLFKFAEKFGCRKIGEKIDLHYLENFNPQEILDVASLVTWCPNSVLKATNHMYGDGGLHELAHRQFHIVPPERVEENLERRAEEQAMEAIEQEFALVGIRFQAHLELVRQWREGQII